jgi:putative methyltransferase (TIGR04325 family)
MHAASSANLEHTRFVMNAPTPSLRLRIVRKLAEIILARLPTGRWLGKLPFFPEFIRERVMARRDHTGLHFGVYKSYAEAYAQIPPSRLAGWDHSESSELWIDQIDPVRPSTYPVFFWLSKLYGENARLLDLGGSIGLTYYGYRRYSKMPANATWTVIEVPKIAEQGRKIAARERATGLSFGSDLAQVGACDLLLSAGALQFMEQSVPGLLERLTEKPRYVLLNKLPMTSGPGFWTLQNYGPAVTPNQIYNENEFIAYFTSAGYKLRDRWAVQDLDCLIPFYPERFVKEFTGYLFERRDD